MLSRLSPGAIHNLQSAAKVDLTGEFAETGVFMQMSIEKAATLARLPLGAFTCIKLRLTQPSASLDKEPRREENDQTMLLLSRDFMEGHTAFMQKRTADFTSTEPNSN